MRDTGFAQKIPPPRMSRWTGPVPRLMMAVLAIFGLIAMGADKGRAIDPLQLLLVPLGSPVPEFSLPSIGEQTQGLSNTDLNGDVSVVNVFASWCVPCRQEHPLLMALADQNIVPVHGLNYKDQPESALRWLEKLGNPYTRIGSDRDGRVAEEWDLYALPQTFVVDQAGRIAFVHTGVLDQSVIDETVLPLISRLRAVPEAP